MAEVRAAKSIFKNGIFINRESNEKIKTYLHCEIFKSL